jgi:hypothetical protein
MTVVVESVAWAVYGAVVVVRKIKLHDLHSTETYTFFFLCIKRHCSYSAYYSQDISKRNTNPNSLLL